MELRRPCFLASQSWMTVPWSEDRNSKSLLDHAVDLMLRIPGLLKKHDDCLCGKFSRERLDLMVRSLTEDMHDWLRKHLSKSPHCTAWFESQQVIDLEAVVRGILAKHCSDAEFAQAVAVYMSTWLLLTRLGEGYIRLLPHPPATLAQHTLAICAEYLNRQDGSGLMPWILSTRIALSMPVPTMELERAELPSRIDQRHSCDLLTLAIRFTPNEIPLSFRTDASSPLPSR